MPQSLNLEPMGNSGWPPVLLREPQAEAPSTLGQRVEVRLPGLPTRLHAIRLSSATCLLRAQLSVARESSVGGRSSVEGRTVWRERIVDRWGRWDRKEGGGECGWCVHCGLCVHGLCTGESVVTFLDLGVAAAQGLPLTGRAESPLGRRHSGFGPRSTWRQKDCQAHPHPSVPTPYLVFPRRYLGLPHPLLSSQSGPDPVFLGGPQQEVSCCLHWDPR